MSLGAAISALSLVATLMGQNPLTAMNGSPPAQNFCDYCHLHLKSTFNGSLSPYCSRTCADSAGALNVKGPSTQITPQVGLCSVCGVKPKYCDGNTTYNFCGRTCAGKASQVSQPKPVVAPIKPVVTGASRLCAVSGCMRPAYRDASKGIHGRFCSKAHKKLADESCIICMKNPPKMGVFCSKACSSAAEQKAPAIIEIPEGHDQFKSVADQFKASWRSGTCPPVRKVYKVITTAAALKSYETYRSMIEAKGRFQAMGRPEGNQNRRWHGTKRQCTLGDPGNVTFCSSTTCALCNIIKTSFSMKFCARGSFGMGIYTSSTSSKSNGYSANVAPSKYKAMLLNKVVVGKGYKLTSVNPALRAPPAGYDSVLAELGAGADELVVFSDDAIRPYYLVIYEP
ncbi:hypothetical protein SCHPADRAFT_904911 [Schizopora paradoxa]|uniref:PARP catalytic domain-containing protein n=1 Tax=Schizopora paradoxa TaxID=27342 RepID=A0A0H2RL09_9AGAM|nr:hypothetical protein SCHPADRAFT_904911 [Schizopora paradoxa]